MSASVWISYPSFWNINLRRWGVPIYFIQYKIIISYVSETFFLDIFRLLNDDTTTLSRKVGAPILQGRSALFQNNRYTTPCCLYGLILLPWLSLFLYRRANCSIISAVKNERSFKPIALSAVNNVYGIILYGQLHCAHSSHILCNLCIQRLFS